VATGTASRSKFNTNAMTNPGMNIQSHLDFQRKGTRGINSSDIVLKTKRKLSYVIYHLRYKVVVVVVVVVVVITTT
jgi:hypothetical protein